MVELVVTPTATQAGDAVLVNRGGNPAMIDVSVLGLNAQTGTAYTLALTDVARLVTMENAASNTLTIPANATVAFPVGSALTGAQIGAGVTRIQGAAGVTLNGVVAGGGNISAQWSSVMFVKIATNTWIAIGSIGAVT
jgi:hypothetical protein